MSPSGIVDVKSYFVEPPELIAERVRECLKHAPPERLSFAPDCGLSQTARWAAKQKLVNLVAGVEQVRQELERALIEPAQRDDELLADIAAGRASDDDHLRLWWLGQAGFLVQCAATTCSSTPTSPTR